MMNANMKEIVTALKAKREMVLNFMARHNNDISGLTAADLENGDPIDKQIHAEYGSLPDWKKGLKDMAENEFPDKFNMDIPIPEKPEQEEIPGPDISIPQAMDIPEKSQDKKWNFQFDVNYLFTLIPYYTGSDAQSMINSRAFALIDDHLTKQPDIIHSDKIPYTYETPRANAISGNFDISSSKDFVWYQANNALKLEEIVVSSVKEYKTIYTESTDYLTCSKPCNILDKPGKEQIVKASLNGTQIGLEVLYFDNGQKITWGISEMFDHGIGYTNLMAFDIAVGEVSDNTLEIVAIASKSQNPKDHMPCSLQTQLIKFVIDLSGKTFRMAGNQELTKFTPCFYFLMSNMVQHIYMSDNLVYLNYMSAENTLTLTALRWDGTSYRQIWKDDYQISVPNYWYSYQAPLLYRNGKTFYFVRIFENGNSEWPYYVEIYEQQDDGTLKKTNSIKFSNSELDSLSSFFAGIYVQGSFYVAQTSCVDKEGHSPAPCIVFYKVDEVNNQVVKLSTTSTYLMAFGAPFLALCNYDIKAQPPTINSLTECYQPVAILDSPPISNLIDYSDGKNYPSLTYLFEKQQSSSENVETKTDRSQSDSLETGFSFFGLSIGASISKKMTDSADQSHTSEFKLIQDTEITSQVQDMTVFLGITYDMYEYPMTIRNNPAGRFLFVVPTSAPHLIINTGQLMLRKTSHQIGNLLSYPTTEPDHVKQLLYTNQFNINANEEFISTLKYDDLHTGSSSTTTTTTVSKSLSVGLEFPIVENVAGNIKGKLEGSYTRSDIHIASFTIENSFELKIQIKKLLEKDANKYFSIEPYFYIDNANIIRCSYRVDVPSGGQTDPSYWKKLYQYPDFGMVMPFHTPPFKEDSKYLLSFDIETNPKTLVKELKELEISATVRNWSLVSGTHVVVAFYFAREFKNNPSRDDLIEIGRQTIDILEPRKSAVVSVKWQNPQLIQPINAVPLYVIIDPDNQVQEMSKDNNFAQMNYPLSSLDGELDI